MSKSQFYQDILVLKDVYDYKENGYFVDIGAYDGEYLSNTYVMEKRYNWKGICVEPVPNLFNQMKKVRDCKLYNVACGQQDTITVPRVFQYVTINHRMNFKQVEHVYESTSSEKVDIPCWTLQKILDEAKAPSFIEYLSIDTDGYDYDVITSVDLDKYTFGVINIERNGKGKQIGDYIEQKGYTKKYQLGVDDIYVHDSIVDGIGDTFATKFLSITNVKCPYYDIFTS